MDKKSLEKSANFAKEKASSLPGALILAAIAGIGTFIVRRKFMRAQPLSAAISAASIAATAFGTARRAGAA